MMTRAKSQVRLAALLVLCSCDPNQPAPAPPGVVMTVTAKTTVEITEAEITLAAKAVEFASQGASDMHYKRLALREIVLPRAAIRAANAEARAEALTRAEQLEPELVDGVSHANEIYSLGDVDNLGPLIIGTMIDLVPGEWSERLENLGSFQFIRVVEPATPELQKVGLAIVSLPYARALTSRTDIETYIDDSVLEVLDPQYGDLVPVRMKHLMAAREEEQ